MYEVKHMKAIVSDFAMIMLVDLADCTLPFDQLSQLLKDKGMERGLDIHVQRQDIFEAMHRI